MALKEGRPTARKLFIEPDRLIGRIYFYTSNIEKYLQARLVFERQGLTVDYFKTRTEPYDEDYGGTSAQLLARALDQVKSAVGSSRLFFVEDTSVRIDALSIDSQDFPGLRVKHWFAETTFEELDSDLKERGRGRWATVKSDIALHVPELGRPVLFHAETRGTVAESVPKFPANPQYPWLTPDTFNGWFIPAGADAPLGALELERALEYDFRARAFLQVIDRLEEYAAALNLPSAAYRVKRKPAHPMGPVPVPLLPIPAFIVVGRTCAGKTTFAEYTSGRYKLNSIEASSVLRSLEVTADPSDDPGGYSYASRALSTLGSDIVARQIVEHLGHLLDEPFVISGFRTLEELEYLLGVAPWAKIVFIEASERTRFERHVRRARVGSEDSFEGFLDRDEKQSRFGLLGVADDLADVRIINEGTLEDYHAQIDWLLQAGPPVGGVELDARPRHSLGEHQLYRCLKVLDQERRPLQCDEIEVATSAMGGTPIRHNNANKVLKRVQQLATRIDPPQEADSESDSPRVRYRITEAGSTFVRLMERERQH